MFLSFSTQVNKSFIIHLKKLWVPIVYKAHTHLIVIR